MQKTKRVPLWRALASVLTVALVASGAALGVAVPASAADGPTISVTTAPRAGGDVTITGSGFSTVEPGLYVGVRPTGGSADSYTVWVSPSQTVGTLPGLGATAPMNLDGSFSVSAPVAAFAEGTSYSIVTRKAHGVQDPSQVTTTAIAYEAAPATATSTSLTVSPQTTSVEGSTVTLTATVSPADAAGSVSFSDGSVSLGSNPVAGGTASVQVSTLTAGAHQLSATFVPADSAVFAGSTATAVAHQVTPVPTQPVFTPALSVFLSDGVTPYTGQPVYTGDQLVVKGSGYDPAANIGGRGVPIPNTLPQGTYVVFGSFLENWKPSAGAVGAARKIVSQKWALAAAVLDQVPTNFQGTIRSQWAEIATDGTFTTTLDVKDAASALSGGSWGVYTYGAGGVNNAAQEKSVAVDYRGERPAAPQPALTVTPSSGLDADGATVTVTGTNFDASAKALYGPGAGVNAAGFYAQIGWIDSTWRPSEGAVAGNRSNAYSVWVQDVQTAAPYLQWTANADGTADFTWTVTIDKATLDAKAREGATLAAFTTGAGGVVQAVNELAQPLTFADAPVVKTLSAVATSIPNEKVSVAVTGDGYADIPLLPGQAQRSLYLALIPAGTDLAAIGQSGSLPNIAVSPDADGAIEGTLEQLASGLDRTKEYEVIAWPSRSNPTESNLYARTPVSIDWATLFPAAPEPAKDPKITVTPSTDLDPAVGHQLTVSGTGYVGPSAANGAYVVFGEKAHWSGSGALPSDGWVSLAWVMPSQIVDGAFTVTIDVPAGTLDPSVAYHVGTSAAHGLSITDRSLDAFADVTVAQPTAPYVAFPSSSTVQQGQTLAITGGGFAEGDLVTAIARSEPVTIGTATANAAGIVSFTWAVPAAFEVGAHTLELSVGGVVLASGGFTVEAATVVPTPEAPAQASCVAQSVSGASIQWGVKESFRSYVTGPIANGAISGGWGAGSGAYSAENDRGRVSYTGAIHYTGHSGALDLTLSNPRIQVTSASSASLILNVQSKGFNGAPDVNASGVVFATLSLPTASETGSRISWNGASATLTAAGADAFAGFYSAGAALDPVSFSFPLGAEVPCDASTDNALAATGADAPVDALWLGLGVMAFGAVLLVAVRRRAEV
ncbi:HtaA domain-containing protein [Microbacterium sp. NPDC089189]|uniref:HtaA domain-containing protein n=1 Tax=Microbacterium sp. NPDC089189 TaxID=3154972 RepID=UPI0034197450